MFSTATADSPVFLTKLRTLLNPQQLSGLRQNNGPVYSTDKLCSVAGLFHDIRMPLTKARMLIELEENTELEKKILPKLDEVNALLQKILTHLKGQHDIEKKEPTDIVKYVSDLTDDCYKAGLPVTITPSSEKFNFSIQQKEFKRAFGNIIDNAIKYGKNAHVHFKLSSDKSKFSIIIDDSGSGLAEHEIKNVFQAFYRGPSLNTQSKNGSGLGLACVKTILENNQINVKLENRAEQGLRVSIIFHKAR